MVVAEERKSGREKMETKVPMGEIGAEDGIVRIEGKNAVYMDPVRVLSAAYASHSVKRDGYHSRALFSASDPNPAPIVVDDEERSRKRKRRKKKVYTLNEKEALAEFRHQVLSPLSHFHFLFLSCHRACTWNLMVVQLRATMTKSL